MKKLGCLTILILLPVLVISQVNFGIKCGTTLSKYRSSTEQGLIPEYRTKVGFQGGAFAEKVITSYFSVQSELLFNSRGAKNRYVDTYILPTSSGFTQVDIEFNSNITTLYIDVPIYLKAAFPSAEADNFTIGVGPIFSYGTSGKEKFKGSIKEMNVNDEVSIAGEVKLFEKDKLIIKDENGNEYDHDDEETTYLKRIDFGFSCFAAYEFGERLILGLNYHYGLKNISKTSEEDVWARSLAIYMGYKLQPLIASQPRALRKKTSLSRG